MVPSIRSHLNKSNITPNTSRKQIKSFVNFKLKSMNSNLIGSQREQIPLKKSQPELSFIHSKINFLSIIPKKNWLEKDDQDRVNDYEENIIFKKIVDKKLKELQAKSAMMFPYSKRNQSVQQVDIDQLIRKLDKQKDLHFLKGPHSIEMAENSLSQEEKKEVKNYIMRKIKMEQLKKMKMGEFKRQTRIRLRKDKLALRCQNWTLKDSNKQMK